MAMTMFDRYLHDPLFRQLVDHLSSLAEQLQLTPTEIREAALLAQIHYEQRHPRVHQERLHMSMRQVGAEIRDLLAPMCMHAISRAECNVCQRTEDGTARHGG